MFVDDNIIYTTFNCIVPTCGLKLESLMNINKL